LTEVNQSERAGYAWPILVEVAQQMGTVTYGELGRRLSIHHRTVRYVLSEIQDYCLEEKLPPITILVVDQRVGKPGAGFIAWDVDDLAHGLELVYGYPWGSIANPFAFALEGESIDSIANAIVTRRIAPADAYAKVKVRGTAQQIFRMALIKAYIGQCALSGYRIAALLEAAHIIPWEKANSEQRMDPCNGILLSVLHHKLFDLRLLTITEDYRVLVDLDSTPRGSPEHTLLSEIGGSTLHLPKDRSLWPNPAYLEARNCMSK
jgi:putative restriction endonuclease